MYINTDNISVHVADIFTGTWAQYQEIFGYSSGVYSPYEIHNIVTYNHPDTYVAIHQWDNKYAMENYLYKLTGVSQ